MPLITSHPATPPASISPEAAQLLYLALNYLVAVLRTPDDPVASGALDNADIALNKACEVQP